MKKKIIKNSYKIFFLLIVLLITLTSFFSYLSKKIILGNLIEEPIDYKLNYINENFLQINLSIDSNLKIKTYYNEFLKEDVQNLKISLKLKKCEKDSIFIYTRYNNKSYSDIYKINVLEDEIYFNLYKSKNNLNFNHFEIHKRDINCIDAFFLTKNYNLPFSFLKKKINNEKRDYINFDFKEINILKKENQLIHKRNNLSYNYYNSSNLKKNFNKSLFYKFYYKDIKKPFYIKDIFLGELYSLEKKQLTFKCDLYKGGIIFLLYDPVSYEIYDYEKCSEVSKTTINIPDKKLLNLLIGSTLFPTNSKEIDVSIFYKN